MANTTEDEWEYEYDENETEDFYIPIDLANVPNAQRPSNVTPKVGHPVLLKSRLRAQHEQRAAEETNSDLFSQDSASVGEIQVNGLHTANPLVMYNDQLLSCQWAGNVGTDMFFAKPDPDSEGKALRSLPDVDLIATSSAKLVANAARLRPKDELFERTGDEERTEDQKNTSASDRKADGGEVRPTPSTFLAKLNAAKAKRGDKSRLTISKEADGTRLVAETRMEEPTESVGREEEGEDTVMIGA